MSSYLTIYLKIKDSDKKIELNSWSRNNEIYQRFEDTIHPAWAGNEDLYTDITEKDIQEMINECKSDIKRCKESKEYWKKKQEESNDLIGKIVAGLDSSKVSDIIELIRRYKEENDYTSDIEGQDELINDYEWCENQLYFILGILDNIKYTSNPDIIGLCCHIS